MSSSTPTEDTVLDRSASAPLWTQFRDVVRGKILQGELAVGAKLPNTAFRASWCAKPWPTWCAMA